MLALNIVRKAYMASPMMLSHLTSVALKGQCQRHSDFETYVVKDLSSAICYY